MQENPRPAPNKNPKAVLPGLLLGVLAAYLSIEFGLPAAAFFALIGWPVAARLRADSATGSKLFLLCASAGAFLISADWLQPFWFVWVILGWLAIQFIIDETRTAFTRFRNAAVCTGLTFGVLAYLLGQHCPQGFFPAAAEALTAGLSQSPAWPNALSLLHQAGYLAADAAQFTTEAALTAELGRSFTSLSEELLTASLPEMLGAAVILCPAASLLIYSRRLRRLGTPDPKLPSFETWHLPRGWGLWTAALYGTGFAMSLSRQTEIAGAMLSGFCAALLSIQGICLLVYHWKRRGMAPALRTTIVTLLALIAPFVLEFAGILDQNINFRRLRGTEKRED